MNPFKLVRVWNSFWFAPVSRGRWGRFGSPWERSRSSASSLGCDPIPWLTDAGIMRGPEARELAGPLRVSILQWVQDPLSVRVLLWVLAGVAIAFTIGWQTRLMSIILYIGMLSVHQRDVLACTGADCLLTIMLFHSMFCPCGASLSLDALRRKRRTGEDADALIVPWGQRLIQIQICILYLSTAILKSQGLSWLNGTAIHFPLNNEEVRRYTFGLDHAPVMLLNILTHTAMLIEFALAFLLWVRAARPTMLFLGFFLHLGMIMTINAPLFSELVLAGYLVFVTPEELTRVFGRLPVFSRCAARVCLRASAPTLLPPRFAELIPSTSLRTNSRISRIRSGSDRFVGLLIHIRESFGDFPRAGSTESSFQLGRDLLIAPNVFVEIVAFVFGMPAGHEGPRVFLHTRFGRLMP